MAKTVMGLCFPLLSEDTVDLLENNRVFKQENYSLFSAKNVLSGVVITCDRAVSTNHLIYQAAVSASYLGKKVLIILAAGKWQDWPSGVHKMPSCNVDLARNWTFLYPTSFEDIVDYIAGVLDTNLIPDTIILQNAENIFSKYEQSSRESDKFRLIKLMAHLTEFLAQKNVSKKASELVHVQLEREWESMRGKATATGKRKAELEANEKGDQDQSEDQKENCRQEPQSEIISFVNLPRSFSEPGGLVPFFDEVWLLHHHQSPDLPNIQYKLDLVSKEHELNISYFHQDDTHYLKSVTLKNKLEHHPHEDQSVEK